MGEKKLNNSNNNIIIDLPFKFGFPINNIISLNNHSNPKSTTKIQIHHFKSTFMCPRSNAGVPFDSVIQASLLLHTTCVRSCCNWRANCVAAKQQTKEKQNYCATMEVSSCEQELIHQSTSEFDRCTGGKD